MSWAFCKLLDDKSTFRTDPEGKAAKLRLQVFAEAGRSHPLVKQADQLLEHEEKKMKAQLADKLGTPWGKVERSLYPDVMALLRLEQFEGYTTA